MEQQNKICAMCRKMVDQAAVLCPHCRSDINYQHFIEVSTSQLVLERRPLLKAISIIVSMVVIGLIGIFGIALAGFWAGIGFTLFAGVLAAAASEKIGAQGYDKARLSCNGCGHADEYRWAAGTLEPGKQAYFDCSACKQRTRLMVGTPPAAIANQPMNQ